ncbi:hypothetical protein [Chitinimonas koreensis]|uniref:hypothetical protein n=1 Tax=Chitinimonas koreensis TaxID=356302 RepID=UPI00041864D1|nr:hypothetical protein [Chitinimonas koreensis]QNM96734.1 hypothetical protein H9L41_23810 [Chitinimonas koreensis]
MDPVLSSLPESLLRFVEDQLSNSDEATDEELHAHFVANGLSDAQAAQALKYRTLYWCHIYLEGFTPIRKGHEALHYNALTGQFELH